MILLHNAYRCSLTVRITCASGRSRRIHAALRNVCRADERGWCGHPTLTDSGIACIPTYRHRSPLLGGIDRADESRRVLAQFFDTWAMIPQARYCRAFASARLGSDRGQTMRVALCLLERMDGHRCDGSGPCLGCSAAPACAQLMRSGFRRCRAVQRVVVCCVLGATAPAVVRHERDGVVAPRLPHFRHDCDGSGEPSPGADVGGGEPNPGADVGGASSVPAQMWGSSPVPAQMWEGSSPAPSADVAGAAVAECNAPVHPVRAAAGRRVGDVRSEALEVSGGGRMASPDRVQRRRRRAGAVRPDEACRMHPIARLCRAEHGGTCAERARMRAQVSSVLPPDEDTVARAWAMRPLAECAPPCPVAEKASVRRASCAAPDCSGCVRLERFIMPCSDGPIADGPHQYTSYAARRQVPRRLDRVVPVRLASARPVRRVCAVGVRPDAAGARLRKRHNQGARRPHRVIYIAP